MVQITVFYIAHVLLAFIVLFFILIHGLKTRNRLRRYFLVFLALLFVWTFSVIGQQYSVMLNNLELAMVFENLTYVGVAFIAPHMLLIIMTLSSSGREFRINKYLLYLIPLITQVMVWTNGFHHAFYLHYGFMVKSDFEFGWYFYIHTAYSYACLVIGIYLILRLLAQNRGVSKTQAIIILIGTVTPVIVNICYTFDAVDFTAFSTPIAFFITLLAYFYGILRYNLLRLPPIAMKTVMDMASDLYIVIDENMVILDYNEPFSNVFTPLVNLKRQITVSEALEGMNKTNVTPEILMRHLKYCRTSKDVIRRDTRIVVGDEVKHYSAEFTALTIENEYYGCIVLLRDITQAKNDMEEIRQNQIRLIEQERLASIGQLMGGIAHNLKTPIMAISGRMQNLESLIAEYESSAGYEKVTADDHREIAREMKAEIENIDSQLSYISEIITTVKDQTIKFNDEIEDSFTIGELDRRIRILIHHELVRNNCELFDDIQVDEDMKMTGDVNSFVQIVNNVILNAIHAYDGAHGHIWLTLSKTKNDVVLSIRDEAGGIPLDVQDKLFKQMITTKGKDGTGLGLYISHSTVVGRYGGKMWFDSVPGAGSEFFISIPLKNL